MMCGRCEKPLKGGFKQPDGTFRCAACVMAEHTVESLREGILDLVSDVSRSVRIGHRPTKTELRHVLTKARAILEVHKL